jgi:hypothetical protein
MKRTGKRKALNEAGKEETFVIVLLFWRKGHFDALSTLYTASPILFGLLPSMVSTCQKVLQQLAKNQDMWHIHTGH